MSKEELRKELMGYGYYDYEGKYIVVVKKEKLEEFFKANLLIIQ